MSFDLSPLSQQMQRIDDNRNETTSTWYDYWFGVCQDLGESCRRCSGDASLGGFKFEISASLFVLSALVTAFVSMIAHHVLAFYAFQRADDSFFNEIGANCWNTTGDDGKTVRVGDEERRGKAGLSKI